MTLAEFLHERIREDEAAVVRIDCRCADGQPQRAECADRVLVECDAKERILAMHSRTTSYLPTDSTDGETCLGCDELSPCQTQRLLGLPYYEHPDYRVEWAPLTQ